MKNNSNKIKAMLLIVLTLSFVSLVSAVSTGDIAIRYSTPNSEGTGIAISQSTYFVPANPATLSKNLPHSMKFTIDNKLGTTNANVHIRAKLDGKVLADYYQDILTTYTGSVNFDISGITCGPQRHTLYLEVYGVYDCPPDTDGCPQDNSSNNNFAQRSFVVSCTPPVPVCGDGVVNQASEECDWGANNSVVCSAGYNSTCDYCSDTCTMEKVFGEYCGDGILNELYEECDDGNRINGDRCSNVCKKPRTTEDFVPIVWQCDHRVVYDDGTEPGRISADGEEMLERLNNYAFEGEQIQWKVLVMDKNGIDKVADVYVTVDGNIEANCRRLNEIQYNPNDNFLSESVIIIDRIDPSCNARILEEEITEFNENTMAYYLCTLTVETPESMYGESPITVEAEDLDGEIGKMDESEFWYLNPFISLGIRGNIEFEVLREGTLGYSDSVIVTNDADDDSGVILDMFISGTDFYDSSNSGAKCPTTNQLSLSNFRYYATSGAYSTHKDARADSEGYVPIKYGVGFNDPNPFYNNYEIIQSNINTKGYYAGNILTPGGDMTLTFRLNVPEPCNGDFDSGQIYFWGEAI